MSKRALRRYAEQHFGGIDNCRPMCRFAIQQGLDPDGNQKWRGIDDAKANGINRACTTHETVFYITFEFPARVARAVYEWCQSNGTPMPEMTIALDDMRAAYRTVPNAMSWLCIIAAWSFAAGAVLYHVVPGHVFGMISSVLNYNR